MNTDGSNYQDLAVFDDKITVGASPYGGVILGGSTLYGATSGGGTGENDHGTVFAINGVPEPSSMTLLIVGTLGCGIGALSRKMRKHRDGPTSHVLDEGGNT